jgi:hypothetical protein
MHFENALLISTIGIVKVHSHLLVRDSSVESPNTILVI